VDSDEILCAGTVEKGATVTVNKSAVAVTTAGFATTLPVKTSGQYSIAVTASAKGKAPKTEIINITKVESLLPSIQEWSKDMEKKLKYPKLARDIALYTGKKISLKGRIININTVKGVTAFLMYISDGCPKGAQCTAYVAFRGETDAGLQSMVTVYGTVTGTRDVELPDGKKQTMPALDAKFVVETQEKKKKRH
jgi:hypothetical protein